MTGELSAALVIEILATTANLVFIILLIREKILCWPFGIAGSLLSIYLFVDARLYSEAFLYLFYALMGVWGWLRWHRQLEKNNNPIIRWDIARHLRILLVGSAVALGLGVSVQFFSDAERPLFDAFTTTFSFIATYMEITKVLEAWGYWLILNLASIWLYQDRNLDIYAVLIGIYSIMSVWGFVTWQRAYRQQPVL
jgi:nicotinamide mononucleotide transporter